MPEQQTPKKMKLLQLIGGSAMIASLFLPFYVNPAYAFLLFFAGGCVWLFGRIWAYWTLG